MPNVPTSPDAESLPPPTRAEMKRRLDTLVREMMEGFINSLRKAPFDLDDLDLKQPYWALLPESVFRGQHIERKFVTAFGKLWERIAAAVGERKGYAETGRKIVGTLGKERVDRISTIVEGHLPGTPNWERELAYVMAVDGEPRKSIVTCDVFISSRKGEPGVAFELKSPKPNRDQVKIARSRLLTLYAMEPRQIEDAYFGLPFNPFGEQSPYDWPHLKTVFDGENDPRLLIGRTLWETVGRAEVFDEFMEVIRDIGNEFHERIEEACSQMASADDAE